MTPLNTRARLAGLAILLAGMMSAHVSGHHGTAVSYDDSKKVSVVGTVTDFWWRNPHSALFLDVTSDKGEKVGWAIELGSPGSLMRTGWTRRTFTAGDTVSIVVNPSRAGTPVGVCDSPCKAIVNSKEIARSNQQ
jgi:hypothetical protein